MRVVQTNGFDVIEVTPSRLPGGFFVSSDDEKLPSPNGYVRVYVVRGFRQDPRRVQLMLHGAWFKSPQIKFKSKNWKR